MKTAIIGDTEYTVDRFYREGVEAFKRSVPWSCNPYRTDSYAHTQWNYGHVNESEGEHNGVQL